MNTSLGCEFSQLQYYQILLKLVNICLRNGKNKRVSYLRHSVHILLVQLLQQNTTTTTTKIKKSDVTIVFFDPDFLKDAKILGFAYIPGRYRITQYLHGFSGPLGPKWVF